MPSSQTLYLITITNAIGGLVAPSDGFIDSTSLSNYSVVGSNPVVPINLGSTAASFSYPLAQANRRGNLRYREIINQLSIVSNCYVQPDTIVSNATYLTPATAFAFQIIVEHGDASLSTPDETVPGSFLTGTACLIRCVARALTKTVTARADVFNPTNSTSVGTLGSAASVTRGGDAVLDGFVVGPYAANLAAATAVVSAVKVVF